MRNFCLMLFAFFSLHVSATVHADFTADKFSGCPPLLVNFSNSSQPSNLTWSWNFGNSNTSTLANPSAVFNTPGVYQVKLIVSNGTEIDSVIKTVTVFHLPQVDFHAQSVQICQNDTVHLFSDVVVGDGAIVDYGWGFGDGVASSSINPSHVYNQSGSYNATLVVQDANGCSANKSKKAYIQVITAPVAAFTASPSSSCNASQSVSFTNSSTGSGLTYFWNLDHAVTSTLSNPTHVYVQEKRNVMLVATNSNGCSDTAYQMIRVGEVVPNFTSKLKGCIVEGIVVTNTSDVGGDSYWDVGDGKTST